MLHTLNKQSSDNDWTSNWMLLRFKSLQSTMIINLTEPTAEPTAEPTVANSFSVQWNQIIFNKPLSIWDFNILKELFEVYKIDVSWMTLVNWENGTSNTIDFKNWIPTWVKKALIWSEFKQTF